MFDCYDPFLAGVVSAVGAVGDAAGSAVGAVGNAIGQAGHAVGTAFTGKKVNTSR
jgi:putative effector of murein hydrolase